MRAGVIVEGPFAARLALRAYRPALRARVLSCVLLLVPFLSFFIVMWGEMSVLFVILFVLLTLEY